jgi:hypothetical protein
MAFATAPPPLPMGAMILKFNVRQFELGLVAAWPGSRLHREGLFAAASASFSAKPSLDAPDNAPS